MSARAANRPGQRLASFSVSSHRAMTCSKSNGSTRPWFPTSPVMRKMVATPSSSIRSTIASGPAKLSTSSRRILTCTPLAASAPSQTLRRSGVNALQSVSTTPTRREPSALITESLQLGRHVHLGPRIELAGPNHLGDDAHAETLLQPLLDRGGDGRELGRIAVTGDRDDELVAVLDADGPHEPVGGDAGNGERDLADGFRPHVHAAQLHHVVAAALERAHAAQPASARAPLARVQVREVHDVVPELWAPGLVQLRDADRARLAVGQRVTRLGIDDLHDERVLEDVESVVDGAFDRDPLDLVEAVRVEALGTERRLEPLAITDVRKGAELEVGRGVVTHLARDVGESQQVVAGREDDTVEPPVKRLVEGERTIVRAVRPRVEDHVARADALHVERASGEYRADLTVPLRVEGGPRLPGGATRHVHAHRLAQGVGRRHSLI